MMYSSAPVVVPGSRGLDACCDCYYQVPVLAVTVPPEGWGYIPAGVFRRRWRRPRTDEEIVYGWYSQHRSRPHLRPRG